MTPILEIQNLSHIYSPDTPFEHPALTNVDLTIGRGEFVGLIGHTGSGKSTLVQHMNGLLKPTSGRVLFDGRDIWEDAKFTRQIRFHVGLVMQYPEYQLFEETVYTDIAFGPKNMGLSKDEIDARVHRAAGFVGISEAELQKSPFDLSGGQKRRAAIAGVIAMEPDVLILDEPTAGLDPAGRESILENIRAYQAAQHAAVVMVSHSMEEIASNVDRLIVMEKGTAVMNGAPGDDLPFRHGDHAPGADRLVHMVRDQDHGNALFTVEPLDGIEHLAAALRVKHGGRLVEHDALRLHGQHACDGHTLLLSAGEQLRRIGPVFVHADGAERIVDAPADLLRRDTEVFGREGHILLDHVRDDLVVGVLKDHADVLPDGE